MAVPGNTAHLTHGAWSARKVEPIAAQLVAGIVVERPDLAEPQFERAVHAWATVEAKCHLLRSWADEHGILDEEGKPLPFTSWWTRLEVTAAGFRARLGLDPLANAQLIKERAAVAALRVDLSEVIEAGRQELAARELEQNGREISSQPADPDASASGSGDGATDDGVQP